MRTWCNWQHNSLQNYLSRFESLRPCQSVSNPNKWKLTAVVGGNTNNSKVTMLSKNRIAAEESDATKHSNELSMIEAGFWCDEYVNRSEVDGKYVYTSTGNSARGATQITGTGNYTKELIYILIPENNSTVNRTIELTLQKVNDSKVSKAVTLTQRCPGWTDDGTYGWETVDDDEDGQYGFTFTRKVAYVYVYSFVHDGSGGLSSILGGWKDREDSEFYSTILDDENGDNLRMHKAKEFVANNYIIPYDADSFTTYPRWVHSTYNFRFAALLDYTVLNNIDKASSITNGFDNTIQLHSLGGSATTSVVETVLKSALKTKEGKNEDTFRLDDNGSETGLSGLTSGKVNDLSGVLSYILKKNRYYLFTELDAMGTTIYAPIILDKDIKWYIPAYGQFESFVPNPNITDKNGGTDSADDYWSSTAAENATNPADAKSYHGGGVAISRATELGVIAVRNKDNDTYEAPATVSVDNSSIEGGDNGDTNSWLEQLEAV